MMLPGCEKIRIPDTGVVGLELTIPYAELLTVEARLALDEAQPPAGGTTDREQAR